MAEDKLGAVLRRFRITAGMTQDELADSSGVSARTISDVERGLRAVLHRDTVRRLASALTLGVGDRTRFEALARPRHGAVEQTVSLAALPTPPTRLLGRTREMAAVVERLRNPTVRVLTLTGPGGIGKTRLAMEAANTVGSLFTDGIHFVSLGELTDAALVAPMLAKSVGIVETDPDVTRLVTTRLADQRALIVLDTFEHLMPAVPLVYDLMRACRRCTFLVTSRSALRLRGELELPVPPLRVPTADAVLRLDQINRWPATALFWERACAIRPDLELEPTTVTLVAEICRKLDGLPLAIELAAARVKHLPLAAIRNQLEHRLDLLVGGPRDLPARQQAIRDTVAWSHDLLATREQILLRRLSVFAGGWDLESIVPVTAEQRGSNGFDGAVHDDRDALDSISALVDHSLVVLEDGCSHARYDMLDVIKEYAAGRLADAQETERTQRRHAMHYLSLAEAAEPQLVRSGHQDWFRRLDANRANLRSGMAWAIDNGQTVPALRYTVALWRYWRQLGELAEGRRWSEAALAVPGDTPPSLRAKALCAASALAFPQGDHKRMAELADEAIEFAGRSDDPMDLRNVLTIRGMVAMCQQRYADALTPYTQALTIARTLGPTWQLGTSYLNLGTALLHAGHLEEAVDTFRNALRVYRDLGDDVFAARVLNNLAHAALVDHDLARAERLGRQALADLAEQGERQGIAEGLETLAAVAAEHGKAESAATLAGAATTVREEIAARAAPFDLQITGRLLDAAKNRTYQPQWARAWHRGRAMNPIDAAAYALGLREASRS